MTENHPEVQAIVKETLKKEEKSTIQPPIDLYVEVLQKRIQEVQPPLPPDKYISPHHLLQISPEIHTILARTLVI